MNNLLLCVLVSQVQVFIFVFNFLNVIFQIGVQAAQIEAAASMTPVQREGWESRGGNSKLKCHKDINRDRMWPPIAPANWLSGKNTKPANTKQAQPMETAGWIDCKQLSGCALSQYFLYAARAHRKNVMFCDQARQKR